MLKIILKKQLEKKSCIKPAENKNLRINLLILMHIKDICLVFLQIAILDLVLYIIEDTSVLLFLILADICL